jgi:hypothetical protein
MMRTLYRLIWTSVLWPRLLLMKQRVLCKWRIYLRRYSEKREGNCRVVVLLHCYTSLCKRVVSIKTCLIQRSMMKRLIHTCTQYVYIGIQSLNNGLLLVYPTFPIVTQPVFSTVPQLTFLLSQWITYLSPSQ